jgi:hypothetical protein
MSRRSPSGKQLARIARRYQQSIGAWTDLDRLAYSALGGWRPVAATPGNASMRRAAEAATTRSRGLAPRRVAPAPGDEQPREGPLGPSTTRSGPMTGGSRAQTPTLSGDPSEPFAHRRPPAPEGK